MGLATSSRDFGLGIALIVAIGVLPASARKPRLLSHFYYVNDPSSLDSLRAHVESISLVSPQWFSVGRAGRLESTVDAAVVAWASGRHLPLMPLLVNEKFEPEAAHAVLADEATQSALIEQVLEAALSHRFYGLELDFERLPAGDRDAYSRFAAALAKALHRRHMKLAVAIPAPVTPAPILSRPAPLGANSAAPRTTAWITNPQSLAFDDQALGKVADFITLMTYDEHASPDDPGPIAGLPWVEVCLQKTLDLIPRKKTLLGIPLYYRRWTGKLVAEGPYEEALRLATDRGAKIEMDPEQREELFRAEDGQNSHVVWLNDARSLEERVELVRKYGLAGFSAWRLGQEDPAVWAGAFSEAGRKIH